MRGAALAVLSFGALALLPGRPVVVGFAVLLGLAAGVYVGFALPSASAGEQRLQWIVAIGFVALAVIGATSLPWLLVAGWLAHAAWDARHHTTRDGIAPAPPWYARLCLVYDVVAAMILTGWYLLA